MANEVCHLHDGVERDLKHLLKGQDDQWTCINAIKKSQNWILGGLAMSLIMLVINLLVSWGQKGAPTP